MFQFVAGWRYFDKRKLLFLASVGWNFGLNGSFASSEVGRWFTKTVFFFNVVLKFYEQNSYTTSQCVFVLLISSITGNENFVEILRERVSTDGNDGNDGNGIISSVVEAYNWRI